MEKYVEIKDIGRDFTPKHIFECGQCFRYYKEKDESYTIVAKNKVINVKKIENNIVLKNTTDNDVNDIWYDYFDLGTDYSNIKEKLSENDKHLKISTEFGSGIRILNQELFECIISFIISANNNIPRIKGIIESLCKTYGEEIKYCGNTYYTFPDIERLKHLKKDDLAFLRAGYRDSYLLDAFNKISLNEVDLKKIETGNTQEAKEELIKIKGIGNKVSDCILLFGNKRREMFPVDVWVKRSIKELYYDELKEHSIQDFARIKFGDFAGYAQQYLFYYMRENSSGGILNGKRKEL